MGVNKLNSVQKATNLKKKSKVAINEMFSNCQDSYSDHRFHAISALISAASPEKIDRYNKLRTTSGTMNVHQQSSPLGDHEYSGDPLS